MEVRVKRNNTTGDICYIDLWPNEMMHWKYLKREKLHNGKYRYWYDKESLKKDIDTRLGISAKEQMEEDMKNLLAAKEQLRTLQSMANKDKALSSKYEQEISELTKKVASAELEAGFERGIRDHNLKKLIEQYSINDRHFSYADVPKEDLESLSSMSSRVKGLESKAIIIKQTWRELTTPIAPLKITCIRTKRPWSIWNVRLNS